MAGSTQAQELRERGRKFSQIIEAHEDGYSRAVVFSK
jgi:hypothetical protein